MDGLWVFLLLIGAAALPVMLACLWFALGKLPLSRSWFMLSLLAGALALILAALMQYFLPLIPSFPDGEGPGIVFLGIFIRIALTEEGGRLLALLLLLSLQKIPLLGAVPPDSPPLSPPAFGAATGLLAGLGFALVENAYYGAADIGITLVRTFTAAPLHGACGARVGLAAAALREAPLRALPRFFSAVAIHGMYNFMIVSPGIPPVFPILVALTALASAVQIIHRGQENK